MATFTSKFRLWNPAEPGRSEELDALVDTGASFSWVSRRRLQELRVQATGKMQFRTIEGHLIEREVAPVFVTVDGHTGGDTVVLAEEGDEEVIGAHTLESLGLAADPVRKQLMPVVGLAL